MLQITSEMLARIDVPKEPMIESRTELVFYCPVYGGSAYLDLGREGVRCSNRACTFKATKDNRWTCFISIKCSKFTSTHEFEETLLRLALEARRDKVPIDLPS